MIDKIIISGLPGSGKTALANSISERLEWPRFSVGDLWREEHAKYVESEPENKISFEEYWKNQDIVRQYEMDKKARIRVEQGRVVADFRYAKLADGIQALRIFISAPLEVRAERAYNSGKYSGIGIKAVQEILAKREKDEILMGKKIYGETYDFRASGMRDPRYDLVINSSILSVEHEADYVIRAFSRMNEE